MWEYDVLLTTALVNVKDVCHGILLNTALVNVKDVWHGILLTTALVNVQDVGVQCLTDHCAGKCTGCEGRTSY